MAEIKMKVIEGQENVQALELSDINECFKEIRKIVAKHYPGNNFLKFIEDKEVRPLVSKYVKSFMAIIDDVALIKDKDGILVDFGDWHRMLFISGVDFDDFVEKVIKGDVLTEI